MGSEPSVPPGGADGDDAPDPELLAAVERASRHVGATGAVGKARPVVRFDAPRTGARRVWVLGALLALSVAAAALLTLIPPGRQSAAEVEADLRWAIANVVREVEVSRARTGTLPDPERLGPLLGEHVVYEPSGEGYVVTGERDGVLVRYDGTVPLEEWLAGFGG